MLGRLLKISIMSKKRVNFVPCALENNTRIARMTNVAFMIDKLQLIEL